ncbi:hypothetical protein ACPOL_5435 [Acidisarcina polymorpha]|uniref:Uncharacterized protein n=1 Tax=Acidisarcina polymorpha TaxID=2211140 RepID=A0A2Z5G614_9BACT|nr:hypothetical protein ACPOL_5435 [Acidisarcina polymorpha]
MRLGPGQLAKRTGAVPLGEATTGSCPQQLEFQQGLDFRGGVAVDLAAEGHFFKIRACPDFRFHVVLLSNDDDGSRNIGYAGISAALL